VLTSLPVWGSEDSENLIYILTLTFSIFPVCVVNYISVNKSSHLRTLFFDDSFIPLFFETTTCFGCSLVQPSSGGDKNKKLVTQVF
jgi:hypothetical protein